MKKYLLLLFLVNITYSFSQNGIIGDGFGVSDWNTTDCFDSSAGSSRIFTTNSNGNGDKYFRLVNCWDNNYTNWGPQNNDDKLLSYGTAYNSTDMIENSTKAYYLNANSSYQYVFKTREGGNPPNNLGVVIFEVQGDIRTVSSVSNNATHSAGEPYTVTATLSGSLSSGQSVYLRYTNDSWNTSSVVEMTGNTTSYSANIPAEVNVAQASISYYIFTSGSGLTISGEDSDFFTINSNTNSGNNFSYDVVDTTAPVITLNGAASVTIEVGSPYNDAGATATDNYDGDLTGSIVVVSNVDTSTVGTYSVSYNVTDTSGNAATEVIRTVSVVDTTAPVITLNGAASVTIEVGSPYNDAGATATDNYDGDLTGSIVVVSNVDTSTVGTYSVSYNVTDTSGNAATEVIRTIIVETLSIHEEIDLTNDIITTTNGNIYFGNTGQYELEIFNVQGQLVQNRYFDILTRGEKVNIDLNRGIYLLKINAIESKKSSVKKILIK